MKFVIGAIIVSLLLFGKVFSQECPVKSGFEENHFGAYYQHRDYVKSAGNIDQIPPDIKEKLFFHLNKRLGSEFTNKLKFDWGEYLDVKKLKKDIPYLYKENKRLG